MIMNKKIASFAAAGIVALSVLLPSNSRAQEMTGKVFGSAQKNGTEFVAGAGFAAQKPLTSRLSAEFDVAFAKSNQTDIVEAAQISFTYKLGDSSNTSITPYVWKDRFYGVDPYGAGLDVSIGKLDAFVEYDEPKVWIVGGTYAFGAGKFTIVPKAAAVNLGDKLVDVLMGELKLSYSARANGLTPFIKFKVTDHLAGGTISTSAQAGFTYPF